MSTLYTRVISLMRARYKVVAAILLVVIVSVLLFNYKKSTGTSNQQHHFHRYFLSHRTALVPLPGNNLYAYVLYATSEDYLCNSIVNAHRLATLNVREAADIVVLYNTAWDNAQFPRVEDMFRKLKALQVRLLGVQVVYQGGDPTWAESLTKLSIFKLTEYRRIIYFDADGLVMKNMNHLFLLPPSPIAMPRAYWLDQPFYSDQIAVIEPSERRLEELLAQAERTGGFDMDVVNDLYKGMCMVLPNEYDLLSRELANTDHAAYMGNSIEAWNATAEFWKASYIHFSDYPMPKPWLVNRTDLKSVGAAPSCPPNCEEQELWILLHTTFLNERQQCL